MKVTFIAAMDKNRVIGKDNDIPWRIPRDWEYVKETTEGHSIILGRRNFESIGRALPKRRNIVLTRNPDFWCKGCEIAHSIQEVFGLCKNEQEIFIFGGEEIYRAFLPYAEKMHITRIDHEFEGDTFFPEVDFSQWTEVSVKKGIRDSENPYAYSFHVYESRLSDHE
ncbi:dihydrofolate reductase [Planomicrobium sp. CPCC 101079]|uniref:dihydrofolate reductase n=1 Tax=Planomicrobium sp. CPCC 101079 TaxID=2599618 RepID=UPI0011B5BC27|nr:dihydrofolate reductase [Planomicrobium sp. CPCC 101079]TWT01911.1 dihydrofolate reductase [Planomicrobium sp. CPCC 101079]